MNDQLIMLVPEGTHPPSSGEIRNSISPCNLAHADMPTHLDGSQAAVSAPSITRQIDRHAIPRGLSSEKMGSSTRMSPAN